VIGTSSASASLYRVLTEGEVRPRSIMLNALVDRLLERARERIDLPRSIRSWRKRDPTSIVKTSFSNNSILTSILSIARSMNQADYTQTTNFLYNIYRPESIQ